MQSAQWSWPTTHGEDHIVLIFGRLHIELAAPKEDLLEDSEWTGALVQSGLEHLFRVDWSTCSEWTGALVQSGLEHLFRVDWSTCSEWTGALVQSGLEHLFKLVL